jgi:shikimate kinase
MSLRKCDTEFAPRWGLEPAGRIRRLLSEPFYAFAMAFIVVTGLPGAGKTTVGRELAASLRVPFLDKDDFLDDLLDQSKRPLEQRPKLSRSADVAFEAQARLKEEAVLVSFWRRPELSLSSGTPTEWIAELADPVELWCRCDPDVAVARFRARRRHPGHGDDHRSHEELIQQFEQLGRLGPIDVGRLVIVDTGYEVVVDDLAAKIRDLDYDERSIP